MAGPHLKSEHLPLQPAMIPSVRFAAVTDLHLDWLDQDLAAASQPTIVTISGRDPARYRVPRPGP